MIEITSQAKLFILSEARAMMPTIVTLTERHYQRWLPSKLRLEKMISNDPRRPEIEQRYEAEVDHWRAKIARLGAVPSALWTVEFDVGDGCLQWRFPELTLGHFRAGGVSNSCRIKLAEYIEMQDPDWAR